MSDLKLAVQSLNPNNVIAWNVNQLTISTMESDILSGKTIVAYELEDTTLETEGYVSRSRIERGSVWIDTSVLGEAVDRTDPNNPVLIEAVMNAILSGFILQLTSITPLP